MGNAFGRKQSSREGKAKMQSHILGVFFSVAFLSPHASANSCPIEKDPRDGGPKSA